MNNKGVVFGGLSLSLTMTCLLMSNYSFQHFCYSLIYDFDLPCDREEMCFDALVILMTMTNHDNFLLVYSRHDYCRKHFCHLEGLIMLFS